MYGFYRSAPLAPTDPRYDPFDDVPWPGASVDWDNLQTPLYNCPLTGEVCNQDAHADSGCEPCRIARGTP